MTTLTTKTPDLRIVRTMPEQKPGKSKQDYATPLAFMEALAHRFGEMPATDLAATAENTKCVHYITAEQNSLSTACEWDDYAAHGSAYLNPPFGNILPWARKCSEARKLRIFFLVPASVGGVWWQKYVHATASRVLFLRPRLEFDGQLCTRRKGGKQICLHPESTHCTGPCLARVGELRGAGGLCPCYGYKKDPYPKDCALVVYNDVPKTASILYECWPWR
ncbi:MAG: DNA N-6-adenine-methyltransferase [Acidimicrobiales bacterium]